MFWHEWSLYTVSEEKCIFLCKIESKKYIYIKLQFWFFSYGFLHGNLKTFRILFSNRYPQEFIVHYEKAYLFEYFMPNSVVNFGKFQYITQIIGDDRYDSENRSRQLCEWKWCVLKPIEGNNSLHVFRRTNDQISCLNLSPIFHHISLSSFGSLAGMLRKSEIRTTERRNIRIPAIIVIN